MRVFELLVVVNSLMGFVLVLGRDYFLQHLTTQRLRQPSRFVTYGAWSIIYGLTISLLTHQQIVQQGYFNFSLKLELLSILLFISGILINHYYFKDIPRRVLFLFLC